MEYCVDCKKIKTDNKYRGGDICCAACSNKRYFRDGGKI